GARGALLSSSERLIAASTLVCCIRERPAVDKVTPFPLWANDPEAEELRQRDRQERAERAPANAPCTVSANAPLDAARAFITASHMAGNHRSLIFHRDSFYSWSGTSYPELAAGDLRACLYDFLDRCVTIDSNGKPIPFKPNRSRVANILEAL